MKIRQKIYSALFLHVNLGEVRGGGLDSKRFVRKVIQSFVAERNDDHSIWDPLNFAVLEEKCR